MTSPLNALRWNGTAGHYEVYYVTLTDRASGVGLWIRATMLAPLYGEPTCSLWLLAMDPRERDDGGAPLRLGRSVTYPIDRLTVARDPFQLDLADASLTERGIAGAFEDVRWELSWVPSGDGREHVHPLLRRAKLAKTTLVLPHPDLEITGAVTFAGRELEVGGRGAQAHLWGSKHAARWAWAHACDLETLDGESRTGDWVDGVSVHLQRLGRELGPLTPVVGRIAGRALEAVNPRAVVANRSVVALTGWSFEARDGDLKVVGEVDADRDALVGVSYHDPDGETAYCYNSEIATMRLKVLEKSRSSRHWQLRETLVAPGRAHFEYGQREPVPGLPLHA